MPPQGGPVTWSGRYEPRSTMPIVTGLLFAFAGIIAVVSSLQLIYERLFEQEHRGWRDFPRFVLWVFGLLGVLILDGAIQKTERSALGSIVPTVLGFIVVAAFF